MSNRKTVTITVDGTNHVIDNVFAVNVEDNGTLIVFGGQGIIRAIGPGHWEEVSVDEMPSQEKVHDV